MAGSVVVPSQKGKNSNPCGIAKHRKTSTQAKWEKGRKVEYTNKLVDTKEFCNMSNTVSVEIISH